MDGVTRSHDGTADASRLAEAQDGRQIPWWVLLGLVCVGQFMVVLDVTIVNVALPSIQEDLGFSTSGLQWVVNAYALVFAGFLLLGGRAGDLFGRRRMFLIGLAAFTTASLVGGLAQSQAMLIAARALQGLGGAVLSPATLAILTASFPEGPARARALGVWTAVTGVGASAGALLGGLLTDLISWRWILFVNVPVGVATIAASAVLLTESRADVVRRHLDVAGALAVTSGLVALVLSIVNVQTHPWVSTPTVVPFGIGVALIASFLFIEARLARSPLVPLHIFRSRSIASANVFMVLLYSAMFGSFYLETLFLQRILGYSPLAAGLAFLPITVLLAVGAQIASKAVARWGTGRLMIIGVVTAALALWWLSRITPDSTFPTAVLGPFLLSGLGLGLSIAAAAVAATTGVSREEAGLASGLLNTARQIGTSLGLAALSTVAANRTATLLAGVTPTQTRVTSAVTQGYAQALEVGAVILVAAGIVATIALGSPQRER